MVLGIDCPSVSPSSCYAHSYRVRLCGVHLSSIGTCTEQRWHGLGLVCRFLTPLLRRPKP
jgi:hypothetical protein